VLIETLTTGGQNPSALSSVGWLKMKGLCYGCVSALGLQKLQHVI